MLSIATNWYPVIDRETCAECGKCIAFCKHGVYDKDSPKKPEVIYPDGCIDHCHGCGSLCPTGSITYAGEDTGWIPPNMKATEDCECGSDCSCGDSDNAVSPEKNLTVDFLYLDLSVCERCIATGDTLDEALGVLAPVFEMLNYAITVNKVNITTEELAVQHRFISSPTIRVNGIDICGELVENECENCGDLAGCSVDCRTWIWEGKEYNQPPTAAIVDGILRVLYGQTQEQEQAYELPENLKKYFVGRETIMSKMYIYEPAMCCDTGICGVGVDPELIRISTVLNALKKNGVEIKRYNLSNYPQEFVKNTVINKLLDNEGVDILPATMIDGEIVKTKAYPTNGEIVMWLNISPDYLVEKPADAGGCCDENSGDSCCPPSTGKSSKKCC